MHWQRSWAPEGTAPAPAPEIDEDEFPFPFQASINVTNTPHTNNPAHNAAALQKSLGPQPWRRHGGTLFPPIRRRET